MAGLPPGGRARIEHALARRELEQRSRALSANVLYRHQSGMIEAGVEKSQIVMIYAAVRGFGWPVYKKPDAPPRYVEVK